MVKRALPMVALLMSGCATVYHYDGHYYDTIPTCASAKECEVKWSAARNWVLNNSAWRLQTYTTDFMQTFGPGDSMGLAVTVTKEAQPDGTYKIVSSIWCGNEYGCLTAPPLAMQAFNDYVNAAYKQP